MRAVFGAKEELSSTAQNQACSCLMRYNIYRYNVPGEKTISDRGIRDRSRAGAGDSEGDEEK